MVLSIYQITTMDLPGSNGWPALYPYHGKIDADIVKLMKAAKGVQFGLTTIPPIAAGGSGWMWESGLCLNPCTSIAILWNYVFPWLM